jgi:hypothetical protein
MKCRTNETSIGHRECRCTVLFDSKGLDLVFTCWINRSYFSSEAVQFKVPALLYLVHPRMYPLMALLPLGHSTLSMGNISFWHFNKLYAASAQPKSYLPSYNTFHIVIRGCRAECMKRSFKKLSKIAMNPPPRSALTSH